MGKYRTLNELILELSQTPAQPNNCARCKFVFDYPEDATWCEAFRLVCEHWKICLADISVKTILPSEDASETDRRSTSPAFEVETVSTPKKRKRAGSQPPTGSSRIRKKNVMDKGTRRQLIERDIWAMNATPKSVECKGCRRTIKLDKRSEYYPGLWHKHRNKCPAIRRVEGSRNKQAIDKGEMIRAEDVRGPKNPEYVSTLAKSYESRNEADNRISRWVEGSGPRYHNLPFGVTPTISRSTSLAEQEIPRRATTRTRLRNEGTPAIRKSLRREDTDAAGTDDNENSDDENYWDGAPFRPEKGSVESSDSELEQGRYRYSTRRELLTRYRNGGLYESKMNEPCSEEVMQAARCLISMKSRTLV